MAADAGPHALTQSPLPAPYDGLLAELEGVYKDIHAHPELSMQEHRTAGIAAAWLRQQGYEVTEGRRRHRRGRAAAQRGRRDGVAARRHGRAADRGEHGPALRQQGDRHRPFRPSHLDRAFLRP